MSSSKKIMFIIPPATGHLNPALGLVSELCKNPNVECIFYGNKEHQKIIENSGAKFRLFCHITFASMKVKPITEKQDGIGFILNKMIGFSHHILPQLIGDVENDKPDLIIYDALFMPAKYLLKVLKARHGESGVPKNVTFMPNFVLNKEILSSAPGMMTMDLRTFFFIILAFFRQLCLSWTFGIRAFNPLACFFEHNPKINLVTVVPDLQPHKEQFGNTYKFVGPCISEEVRSIEISDPKLKKVLDLFETPKSDLKLVYMSLGSVWNNNVFIYEAVINAIRDFNNIRHSVKKFKGNQLRFIFSVGDDGLRQFNEKIAAGKFQLPENVLLFAKVPQLEVLKKANLFITHSGMGSTCEAIKYAVPMICIPINADQPVVSRRICDELSMGKRLEPLSLDAGQIGNYIDEILSNDNYKKNVDKMSKISAKYNGHIDGAKLIMDYINEKDSSKSKKSL